MLISDKDVYSEVYSVLNLLGDYFIEKIPVDTYKMIKENRNKDYNPIYNLNISLDKQKISRRSLSVIALFDVNYWSGIERKSILKEMFKQNGIQRQKELSEKYKIEDMFKPIVRENKNTSEEIIVKEEKNIFYKILDKIKNLFKKKG